MTHMERRERLRAELQQQTLRQAEIEQALRQTQAQVLRLQGALALLDEILSTDAPAPVADDGGDGSEPRHAGGPSAHRSAPSGD